MEVKIKLNGGIMPKKAHPSDAAFDLYVPDDVVLQHGRQIIDLKFSIELPVGYAATIQPRSGFSSKGIEVEEHFNPFEGCEDSITIERVNGDVLRGLLIPVIAGMSELSLTLYRWDAVIMRSIITFSRKVLASHRCRLWKCHKWT